ncbi:DUF3450 domain-containing protein [Alishewanella sp. HH-ZS]|uniref:DUF3450 domain-containing protein n=1 Tax=Alishewanella sp. HH-ZS TaxID=1856684 RepID=UPI0008236C89|nr:DUF3450 domain-containing protein [Alishewanella sp. HH-ZS]OCW98123.1 hypothetical protein A9165_02400 [Alishewanella sp. HH-ZS]
MFNKKIHMSLVASALAGSFALAGSAAATDLKDLHQANAQIQRAAVQSQEKINTIYEQTQELLGEYRGVVVQTDNLKVYNDFLATLVADQQRQIDGLEKTNQGTVPLMFRMIDSLEQFIQADIPLRTDRRLERVQRLRDLMARSDVQRSEQFRQILEAYEIEMGYGTELAAFQGTLNMGGSDITVDFVHLGRLALMALALDGSSGWVYNKSTGSWDKLADSYLPSIGNFIKMARREATLEMDRVPLFAAE